MATNPYFSWSDRSASERFGAELARAGKLNDAFDAIGEAFDAIEAEEFAPLASPAFTGTPTAPTPALSTDTTQIPTTAWVNSLIGSLTVGLPSQLTHGGKVLWTNGTSASWALPIASQTGHSGKYLTTNGTVESWARMVGGLGAYTALTTSTALSTSARILDCTSATYGQVFRLPDATTLALGETFTFGFAANTTNTFGIEDSTGALISSNDLGADDRVTMYLCTDIGTAAGAWKRWRPSYSGGGFEAMPAVPQVIGPNTTILSSGTHVQTLALGSDKYLCVGIVGTTLHAYVVTIATASIGPATITKGTAVTLAADAAEQSRLVAISTGYAFAYVKPDAGSGAVVKVVPMTVSGTTVTIGSLSTVVTGPAGGGYPSATGFDFVGDGGSWGVIAVLDAANGIGAWAVFLSAGPPTINLSSRVTASSGTSFSTSATQLRLTSFAATKFLLGVSTTDNSVDSLRSVVLTASGGPTLTVNSNTSTAVAQGSVAVAAIDSTNVLLAHGITSGATAVRVVSIAGAATPTHNASVSLGNNTGTSPRAAAVKLTSSLLCVHMGSASVGHLYSVGVSGTTPSVNGTALASVSFDLTPGLSYDGTNVAVAASSTGGTLYSVTGSGISVLSSALDANLLSGGHGGVPGNGTWFRTSLTKTYALFGRAGTGQVYRYAGVA
jgi:hypothetical protein